MTSTEIAPPRQPPLVLPAQNLAELVDRTAARYARQKAFTAVLPNGMAGSLTFEDVAYYSDQVAAFLRGHLGLAPGDRVAVLLPNSLAFPLWAFGVIKAGLVLVSINPLYTAPEVIKQINDSEARVLVIVDLFADKLPQVMGATRIERVILVRLTDLFPRLTGLIAHSMMRYVKKLIPPCTVPAMPFTRALALGAGLIRAGKANVRAYYTDLSTEDLMALQYTGGTTGVSKGAMLTHGNLLANIAQVDHHAKGYVNFGSECALAVLPLYHIFAFTANMLFLFYAGTENILIASPRPMTNLRKALENYPITWIPGVNTLFNALLNEEWFVANPPPKLRYGFAGGASLHLAVAERWRQVTGTEIIEGYGLTETSPVVSITPFVDNPPGSIGRPMLGTEVCLLDDNSQPVAPGQPGELTVRGPQVMRGYWHRPGETAKVLSDDGWLRTGDIAEMDDNGFLKIVDRKKDLILVSGFNVYPNEVEECIAKLPGVSEVAVISVPDEKSGERVTAFVVPRQGATLTPDQVREHCRQFLTGYKVPRHVELRTDLPKTNVGKVLRRALRDEARSATPAIRKADTPR
jgi:long-chain acyl-CoA synthetase